MKKTWKKLKGYEKRYKISNYGEVYSLYSKRLLKPWQMNPKSKRLYVGLNKNGKTRGRALDRLVFKHFDKRLIWKYKHLVIHLNFQDDNNRSTNLDRMKFGDALRRSYEHRNVVRGVYTWRQKMDNGRYLYKFRAAMKVDNKVKTLGYFHNYSDALKCYYQGYVQEYGRAPFELGQ